MEMDGKFTPNYIRDPMIKLRREEALDLIEDHSFFFESPSDINAQSWPSNGDLLVRRGYHTSKNAETFRVSRARFTNPKVTSCAHSGRADRSANVPVLAHVFTHALDMLQSVLFGMHILRGRLAISAPSSPSYFSPPPPPF